MGERVEATRLVIFLSEDDRAGRRGLHEVLLDEARREGLAGATVWRGSEGYGASGLVRTARFPDADLGLPVTLEVIDRPEPIERFLGTVRRLAPEALVTSEKVEMMRSPADPGREGGADRLPPG